MRRPINTPTNTPDYSLRNLQFHVAMSCQQAHALLQGIRALLPECPQTTAARTLVTLVAHKLEEIEDVAVGGYVAETAERLGIALEEVGHG